MDRLEQKCNMREPMVAIGLSWWDKICVAFRRIFMRRPPQAMPLSVLLQPPPAEPPPPVNRATRRKMDSARKRLEKQRRKFDKFVEPQGPTPTPVRHVKPRTVSSGAPAVLATDAVDDDDGHIIADVHHTDRKTEVLYEETEFYGSFNFRDTILDQLERYFVYLERMKKHDADAYGFYRNVGATLVPYAGIPDIWAKGTENDDWKQERKAELSPWFLATRPAFGCIAYGTNPEIEKIEATKKIGKWECWVPKFLYFVKYEVPPAELQPMSGGDIYKMTVWWDRPEKGRKYGIPNDFGIFVSRTGEMVALRQIETKMLEIYSKKYRDRWDRNPGLLRIPQRMWQIPHNYAEWSKHHNVDVQTFLTGLFQRATHMVELAAYSMFMVSAEKNGRYATFRVDADRMPYFFKDRDIELGDSGQRKRIFHIVRPQVRKDGTVVKMHFRGQREFTWAGYNIKITVPGRDHLITEEIDLGVTDSARYEPGVKYITEAKFGEKIRKLIK